jgi:hypothetical protein
MVRAILEGRKTVTRRVVKPQPPDGTTHYQGNWNHNFISGHFVPMKGVSSNDLMKYGDGAILCPYGQAGDRMWVKEAWRVPASLDAFSGSDIAKKCIEAGYRNPWAPIRFEADGALTSAKDWHEFGSSPGAATPGRYRNARFMPRWASRLTLELTATRVERLQDVTEESAWNEGVQDFMGGLTPWKNVVAPVSVHGFAAVWESINGAGSWAANPWVWVVEFRRVEHVPEQVTADYQRSPISDTEVPNGGS